jgi:hypothetical protein
VTAHAERRSAGAALAALGAAALGWLAARRLSRSREAGLDRACDEAGRRLAEERRFYARLGEGERPFDAGSGRDACTPLKGRPLEGVEPGTRR